MSDKTNYQMLDGVFTEEGQALIDRVVGRIWDLDPRVARQAYIDLKTSGEGRAAALIEVFKPLADAVNDNLEARGHGEQSRPCNTLPPFTDLAPIFAGDLSLEKPTIAEVLPGKFLLYAGRINEQHGEPAVGKSNIALILANREMEAGRDVIFLDPEDNAAGICRKLVAFGADPETVISHFKYCQNPTPEQYLTLHVWADRHKPSLVVLDGLADALAAESLDEDKAGDFLLFCRNRLRPFTASGCAVLVSDHVIKSSDRNGRWSRGTGAKIGRYDGVVFEMVLKRPYSPTSPGAVELKVAKDRNGGVGKQGETVLAIEFSPRGDGVTDCAFCEKSTDQPAPDPTWYMEKVSMFLEIEDDAGAAEVRKAVGRKAEFVDKAIAALERQGFIRVKKSPGRKTSFEVVRQYRQEVAGQ